MKKTYHTTPSNYANHTTFGGLICYSDFNTEYRKDASISGSSIAKDILSDWKFDQKCKKNIEDRNRQKNYKKVTNA